MSFNILIIEDCEGTSGILSSRLEPTIRSASPRSLPAWKHADGIRFEIETITPQLLQDLVAVNGTRMSETVESVTEILERYFDERPAPNLLVLDLALSDAQVTELDKAGGGDSEGLTDPESALKQTTGFLVLQAWAEKCPVLVTTYASNPHVVRRCLDAGAHDVVVKPLKDEDMIAVNDAIKNQNASIAQPTPRMVAEAEEKIAQVETYVRCVAHEILKAVRAIALHGLEGAAPSHVPLWLATDRARIDATALDGTNLMLIDVRGFSQMVHEGKSKPIAVFEIMNTIWEEIFTVLQRHEAEVNNFIGDAALVFRGVYGHEPQPASLADTLSCACEINELFEPDRELKSTLIGIVEDNYGELFDTEIAAREEMLKLVGHDDFGVRVISIQPDAREALYGKVGPSHRWQHTILSRFMNFLARGESAISSWEKQEPYERRTGESFLLWRKDRSSQPEISGFTFELPDEFAGKERDPIRDVPEHVEFYRVVPDRPGD